MTGVWDHAPLAQLALFNDRGEVIENIGTQGRTRTGTPAKAGDFESPASTIPPLGPRAFPTPGLRHGQAVHALLERQFFQHISNALAQTKIIWYAMSMTQECSVI